MSRPFNYTFILFIVIYAVQQIPAQNIVFNDIRLEIELLANSDININRDSYIQYEEAAAIKYLDLSNKQIKSLDGIAHFSNLEYLDCSHNVLQSIDLSENIFLEQIDMSYNQLTRFDLTEDATVKIIYCQHNQLQEIVLGSFQDLQKIDCSFNQIKNLDVHFNKNLSAIDCSYNKISYLNIANGNNHKMNAAGFNAEYNYLNCVRVDNAHYSEKKWINRIDSFSFYSHKCVPAEKSLISL